MKNQYNRREPTAEATLPRQAEAIARDVLRIAGLALAYFFAHQLAFFFPDSSNIIMLVWPAGGVGLAAFLLNPRRLWPALILAFYISGITADIFLANRSFMTGVGYMTGNMIESIGCAWIILYWARDFRNFTQVREILALIIGAVFVNAFSSCFGAATSVLTRDASFLDSWQSWYIADSLGVLLIGPFIVTWFSIKDAIAGVHPKKIIEGVAFVTIWSIINLLIFQSIKITPQIDFHPYILVALLAWPALRLGQRGVTLALMLLFAIAIVSPAIVSGPSPWDGHDLDLASRLLELQLFLGFLAIVGYLLAAGYADRKQAEAALRESENRFHSLFNSSSDAVMTLEPPSWKFTSGNPATVRMFGTRSEEHFLTLGPWELSPEWQTDGRASSEKARVMIETAMREGSHFFEWTHQRINGEAFPATVLLSRMKAAGKVFLQATVRDITQSKQAEATLRQSEAKFRLLSENSISGVVIIQEGRFGYVNPAMARITGYSREELLAATSFLEFVVEEDRSRVRENISRLLAGKLDAVYGFRVRKKDGLMACLETLGCRINLEDRAAVMATVLDITERKRAEENMARLNQLNELILGAVGEGILGLDLQGNHTFVNPDAARMLGYKAEELLGRPSHSTWHHTKSDGSPYPGEECEIYAAYRDGAVHRASNEVFWRKDGTSFPVEYASTPIYEQDRLAGAVVTFTNITDRKRAEAALRQSEWLYRSLVDNIPQCILRKDREGRFTFVDKSFCHQMGKSPEEILGKTDFDFYPSIFAEKYRNDDRQVMETQAVFESEEENILPDGEIRQVHAIKVPILDSSGDIAGIQCIFEDITDRKRAEAEREKLEAQNRLLQKSESLGRMAGAIAHHFNNQLQAVMMNLKLAMIALPRAAGGVVENLSEAMQSTLKAAEMSSLMLTYLGQTVAKRELLDLSVVCQRHLSLLRATMPNSVVLETDLPDPGSVIRADANQLLQVLTNLVTNAWEASGKEQGTIRLTVKAVAAAEIPAHRFPIDWQPKSPSYACLEVADTGGGIPAQDIDKIFDPFFSTKFAGRGMGLAVVLGIVRAHHGAITVSSKPGQGSIFRVFFPVSPETAPRKPVTVAPAPEFKGDGTLLLVEDEPSLRRVVATALTQLGFTVLAAADGLEAVELFRQHQAEIRCVLCDLTMPRMNGWETLTALRQLAPGIPFILSSGYNEAYALAGEHPELPQAFLSKPYELETLINALRQALAEQTK